MNVNKENCTYHCPKCGGPVADIGEPCARCDAAEGEKLMAEIIREMGNPLDPLRTELLKTVGIQFYALAKVHKLTMVEILVLLNNLAANTRQVLQARVLDKLDQHNLAVAKIGVNRETGKIESVETLDGAPVRPEFEEMVKESLQPVADEMMAEIAAEQAEKVEGAGTTQPSPESFRVGKAGRA